MFKREKLKKLSMGCEFDVHKVPIYHASAGSRKVPLLKTLMSSYCQNDCRFCMFRSGRCRHRNRWAPMELAKIAFRLWKMRRIQGIFLSSSVERNPNHSVEMQLKTVEIVRRMGFTDYVHTKIMPGTNRDLIKRIVRISDKVGINLEFPSPAQYDDMKLFLDFKQDVIKRMRWLSREIKQAQKDGKCKAGLDTQFVVGASDETDKQILKMSEWMYHKMGAQRVYYSGFHPIKNTPLENKPAVNKWREYRLYQSSFLLRDYGFKAKDFVLADSDDLFLNRDPKFLFAVQNELTVDVNDAVFGELIKVPGIGLKTAQKIIDCRPVKDFSSLKKLGVLKRSEPFVEIDGRYQAKLSKWFRAS